MTNMASNKEHGYGVFESNSGNQLEFTGVYARTADEARRYCVEKAKKIAISEFEKNKESQLRDVYSGTAVEDFIKNIKIKWLGEELQQNGIYLMYGLPGDEKSLINVIMRYNKPGYIWGYTVSTDTIASIEYRKIYRAEIPRSLPPAPAPEVISFEVDGAIKKRNLNDIREKFLFSIENHGKNLKKVRDRKQ